MKKILIGLVAILFLCGIIAVVGSLSSKSEPKVEPGTVASQKAEVIPVAETKPTATVIAINAPSPLPTPTKPTTIAPITTPSPIATPLPMNTASTATVPTATPVPSGLLTEAKVVRVIDGDTIEVDIAGKKYTLRYIGINTPETVDPRRPVEYYGKEASAKNKELVEGKAAHLEKDVSETDRYGRLLRYVYVGDTMINAELVRHGYAQSSAYPPDVKYQELFVKLQREAREASRGLWANAPDPTPAQTSAPMPTVRPASSVSVTETEGEWVTSSDRRATNYYRKSDQRWQQLSPANRVWFKTLEDLLAVYPDRKAAR